jgi:hypothetical protein
MASPTRALKGLPHPGRSTHISPYAAQGASESPRATFPIIVRVPSAKGDAPRAATPNGSDRPNPDSLSTSIARFLF